jgi:type III restriction enzyme
MLSKRNSSKKLRLKVSSLRNLSGTNRYMYLADIVIDRKKPPRARLGVRGKTWQWN